MPRRKTETSETSKTTFFEQLNEEQKGRIDALLPNKIKPGNTLYMRVDLTGKASYMQMPTKIAFNVKEGKPFKFTKCTSLKAEREKLAKIIFEQEGGQ